MESLELLQKEFNRIYDKYTIPENITPNDDKRLNEIERLEGYILKASMFDELLSLSELLNHACSDNPILQRKHIDDEAITKVINKANKIKSIT